MGLTPEQLQGADWADMAVRVNQGQSVLEEEQTLTLASTGNCPGVSIPVSLSAARILNDQGESLGLFYLLRDLREVKRLQSGIAKQRASFYLGQYGSPRGP